MSERLIAGAMSGTSADGVDVAIVRIEGVGLEMRPVLLHHQHRAYNTELTERILSMRSQDAAGFRELAEVARQISITYAVAVNEALMACSLSDRDLACIAAHGQTLFHSPPLTIQLFDPAQLAVETGCSVVSDFRRADCAMGGQGAPLVPFADYILFRSATRGRVIVNIGGIANITWIPAGGVIGRVLAYDTGPGNCISDHLMRVHSAGRVHFDDGGRIAATGSPILPLVQAVLADPYFTARPPKSTDGPAMLAIFERQRTRLKLTDASLPDLLASACEITAGALVGAIHTLTGSEAVDCIFAGGGTLNQTLTDYVGRLLGSAVRTTDDLGVPSQAREAMAFALLGAATLDGVPASLPSVTGARRGARLGSITPVP